MRSGRWKLHVQRVTRDRGEMRVESVIELYDLHADIGETTNVAAEQPQVVERLRALAEWAREDLGDGDRAGQAEGRTGEEMAVVGPSGAERASGRGLVTGKPHRPLARARPGHGGVGVTGGDELRLEAMDIDTPCITTG
mgnify:CR=1 FL=1